MPYWCEKKIVPRLHWLRNPEGQLQRWSASLGIGILTMNSKGNAWLHRLTPANLDPMNVALLYLPINLK